jgi:predicted O-linked N-acetylglucosamine transferase (SPINDLY family)
MTFLNDNKLLLQNNIKYNFNNTNTDQFIPFKNSKKSSHHRIKLGFYSADFRIHPVTIWLAEQVENHDKSKFELYAFSFQSNYYDPMRERLQASFDHFIVADSMSNFELVELSRKYEIDIAIDLSGYTQDNRSDIFAARVAPIQINHLGFPGTSGSKYIDFFISQSFCRKQPVYQQMRVHWTTAKQLKSQL